MMPERNGFHPPSGGHTGNGASGKRSSSSTRKGSTRPHAGREVRDLPLVEEDGLSFRVITGVRGGLARHDFDPLAVAEGFRAAFAGVWKEIPPADRQRMLAYWRRGGDSLSPASRARDGKPAPLIRVACGAEPPDDVIARCGMEISFPASLVLGQPRRLVGQIARALAGVYRLATREHWGLVLEQIDGPLEIWERQQGAHATDTRREKKLDELEAEYLRRVETRTDQLLERWAVESLPG